MPDLDLRAVEIVAAVVRHQSFTGAAEALGIAQASVSQRVRQLEDVVGTTLIDRKTKAATEPGRIVLRHGERALRELASATRRIDDLLGLRSGTLRLGVIQMVGFLNLPDVIASFHQEYPAIDISLVEDNAERMISMLQAGELDLVISNVVPGEAPGSGLEHITLGEEPFVLVASAGLTLEGSGSELLVGVRDHPMASFGPGSSMRVAVDAVLDELGIQPRIAFETNRLEMIEGLVAKGLAWSIVPESLATSWTSRMARWDLATRTRRRVALSWSIDGGLVPAAAAFRDLLRAARKG